MLPRVPAAVPARVQLRGPADPPNPTDPGPSGIAVDDKQPCMTSPHVYICTSTHASTSLLSFLRFWSMGSCRVAGADTHGVQSEELQGPSPRLRPGQRPPKDLVSLIPNHETVEEEASASSCLGAVKLRLSYLLGAAFKQAVRNLLSLKLVYKYMYICLCIYTSMYLYTYTSTYANIYGFCQHQ